ncbi:response regulator [Bosea thiooxidans]
MMASRVLVPGPLRHKTVVIADDSVVVRGLFARWLGEAGHFHVVAVAGDGETAVAHATRYKPDVMVLDLDMPGVDGAAALPQILRESPRTGVLLAATLNERNTRIALECMTKGAMDVVSKPDSRSGMTLSLDFRSEFLLKLRQHRPGCGKAWVPAAGGRPGGSAAGRPGQSAPAGLGDAALSRDRRLYRWAARRRQGAVRHRRGPA